MCYHYTNQLVTLTQDSNLNHRTRLTRLSPDRGLEPRVRRERSSRYTVWRRPTTRRALYLFFFFGFAFPLFVRFSPALPNR